MGAAIITTPGSGRVPLMAAPGTPSVVPEAVQRDTSVLPLYTADPDHSSLSFTVRHLKLTRVRGVFHQWRAALSFDPDDLPHSSVTVVVDVASLDTDNRGRDRDLRSAHFFDVERFPRAVFQSTNIRRTADGFIAQGQLRIRDVVRPVAIPFVHTGSFVSPSGRSRREGFEGSLTLTRADYGVVHEGNILETSGAIGKDVTLEIELSAILLNWEAFPFRASGDEPTLGMKLLTIVTSQGAGAALAYYRDGLTAGAVPETSRQDMAILAGRLAARGMAATAASLVKLYAASEAQDGTAQLLAAETLLRAGARVEAVEYYRRALRLDPGSAEAAERVRTLTGLSHETTLVGSE